MLTLVTHDCSNVDSLIICLVLYIVHTAGWLGVVSDSQKRQQLKEHLTSRWKPKKQVDGWSIYNNITGVPFIRHDYTGQFGHNVMVQRFSTNWLDSCGSWSFVNARNMFSQTTSRGQQLSSLWKQRCHFWMFWWSSSRVDQLSKRDRVWCVNSGVVNNDVYNYNKLKV